MNINSNLWIKHFFELFDLTNSMIMTDGFKIFYRNDAFNDIKNKKLVFCNVNYPFRTIERMVKFSKEGYEISENQIHILIDKIRVAKNVYKREY